MKHIQHVSSVWFENTFRNLSLFLILTLFSVFVSTEFPVLKINLILYNSIIPSYDVSPIIIFSTRQLKISLLFLLQIIF